MMKKSLKMLVAGVGGQGVVYLTKFIVEAAVLADLPVASSEIHGLAQRGGSVVAGITFGENSFGFIERGGADFLIGLEPLEAQRCLPFLNADSRVVIDDTRVLPYSVNAQKASYPDSRPFFEYLENNVGQVVVITRANDDEGSILRNIYVLGRASMLDGFPISNEHIETAIKNEAKATQKEESLETFRAGRAYGSQ